MKSEKSGNSIFAWLGVILLQIILTQVVTFVVSLFFPGMEGISVNQPALLTAILTLTFSIGVFLGGWLALKRGWLAGAPKPAARLLGAVVGAGIPLLAALLIYGSFEPGNPVFWISILASILGFHLPGWARANSEA